MRGHIFYLILSFVTLLVLIAGEDSETENIFSSVEVLDEILYTELSLIETLNKYLVEKKNKLSTINRFLKSYENEHQKAANNIEDYLNNPINGYMIIKRLTSDWDKLNEFIANAEGESKFINKTHTLLEELSFKKDEGLSEVVSDFGLLQKTYELSTSELANGTIYGIKYGQVMSADDCYHIGVEFFKKEDFSMAAKWFNETLMKIETEIFDNSLLKVNYRKFVDYYLKTLDKIGNLDLTVKLFNKLQALNINIENGETHNETKTFEHRNNLQRKYLQKVTEDVPNPNPNPSVQELYEKACRKELVRSPSEERHLRCRYVTNKHPFIKLAAFKYEELSLDPHVVLYHNVIYESEIDAIINTAEPSLVRSTVGSARIYSNVRTSTQTWLHHNNHEFLQPILQRLHDITSLNILGAEALQVANYAISNKYGPHWDFFQRNEVKDQIAGNRMATAMFYIGAPEQGGATAFPFLKIAVQPIRGSLLFWYNLHESLEPDFRTKHAGCPVLIGSKWIANEWYHEKNQEFYRPCSLHQQGNKSIHYEHYN